jgi:hypothetical protein
MVLSPPLCPRRSSPRTSNLAAHVAADGGTRQRHTEHCVGRLMCWVGWLTCWGRPQPRVAEEPGAAWDRLAELRPRAAEWAQAGRERRDAPPVQAHSPRPPPVCFAWRIANGMHRGGADGAEVCGPRLGAGAARADVGGGAEGAGGRAGCGAGAAMTLTRTRAIAAMVVCVLGHVQGRWAVVHISMSVPPLPRDAHRHGTMCPSVMPYSILLNSL